MADVNKNVNVKVNWDDQGANRQADNFKKKVGGIKGTFKNIQSSVGKTFSFIKSNWLGLTASIGVGLVAIKKAFDLTKSALKFQQSIEATRRQFGINTDIMLKKLREASEGTISNAGLVEAANRAMALNVTKDVDKMAKLLEVARVRAKAMGLDTTQAFLDITTGIGRNSPLILDNLGIITKGWADEAKAAGKAFDTQFILNKVLADGAKIIKESGDQTVSQIEKLQKFQATIENLGIAIGGFLADYFEPIINHFNLLAKGIENLFKKAETLVLEKKLQLVNRQLKENQKELAKIEFTEARTTDELIKNAARREKLQRNINKLLKQQKVLEKDLGILTGKIKVKNKAKAQSVKLTKEELKALENFFKVEKDSIERRIEAGRELLKIQGLSANQRKRISNEVRNLEIRNETEILNVKEELIEKYGADEKFLTTLTKTELKKRLAAEQKLASEKEALRKKETERFTSILSGMGDIAVQIAGTFDDTAGRIAGSMNSIIQSLANIAASGGSDISSYFSLISSAIQGIVEAVKTSRIRSQQESEIGTQRAIKRIQDIELAGIEKTISNLEKEREGRLNQLKEQEEDHKESLDKRYQAELEAIEREKNLRLSAIDTENEFQNQLDAIQAAEEEKRLAGLTEEERQKELLKRQAAERDAAIAAERNRILAEAEQQRIEAEEKRRQEQRKAEEDFNKKRIELQTQYNISIRSAQRQQFEAQKRIAFYQSILDEQSAIANIEGSRLRRKRKKEEVKRTKALFKEIRAQIQGTTFEAQEGGQVPGRGRGDIVPANLEPGEFVINREATAKFLPLLEAINSMRTGTKDIMNSITNNSKKVIYINKIESKAMTGQQLIDEILNVAENTGSRLLRRG